MLDRAMKIKIILDNLERVANVKPVGIERTAYILAIGDAITQIEENEQRRSVENQ